MTMFPSPGSVPVSVIIPVKNEEYHLPECIRSVRWANEIIVVDSQSRDNTCALATQAGATVLQFYYTPGQSKKKNWTLETFDFRNEWILILDADERITPELAHEIDEVVHNPGECVGFYLNRRFFFLGRFIRHAGYYPSWNLRLIRRGCGFYEKFPQTDTLSGDNEVHEHVILQGKAAELTHSMDHFAYLSVDQFVEKHMRYSNWEARVHTSLERHAILDQGTATAQNINIRRRLKQWARMFPFPHWLRFFYHYFWKAGCLDGKEGYIFCHLLAEYEFWIWAKRFELTKTAKGTPSELKV